MATDFQFSLENRPGEAARVLAAVCEAGVNVIGLCDTGARFHLAVENGDKARTRQALEGVGVAIRAEREVTVVSIEDRPGAGAALLQRIADAGVNVDFIYLATNTRVILAAENPEAVQQVLSG